MNLLNDKINKRRIKVLVVEGSMANALTLKRIIESDGTMEVVSIASNGEEAIEACKKFLPDLITMDINIPRLNGLEATRRIMAEIPTPIVIVSSFAKENEQAITFEALRAGAVEVLPKVKDAVSAENEESRKRFVTHLANMAHVKVVMLWSKEKRARFSHKVPADRSAMIKREVVVIGASTGGPAAIEKILSELPAQFNLPIVVVQHIASGFTQGLVNWLSSRIQLKVKVAEHAEALRPETVYFAPDDRHIEIRQNKKVYLSADPPIKGHRPSIDVLFKSVSRSFGAKSIGVILTGMGSDGAQGLLAMKTQGALTIAQDEDSAVIFGMPKEAVLIEAARYILPLDEISKKVVEITSTSSMTEESKL